MSSQFPFCFWKHTSADQSPFSDYVYISQSKGIPTEPNGHDEGDNAVDEDKKFEPALRPLNSPLSLPKEWQFPLELTLEELFQGTTIRFRVTRRLLTGKTKQCLVVIDIPQGTYAGTKIRCPGIGHERKNGTRQDVVFIVAEKPHNRFERVEDDLFLEVLVPYVDQLAEQGGDITVEGIDGTMLTVNIPYPIEQTLTDGKVIVKGAGMPFCDGRGDLIVKCVLFNSASYHDPHWLDVGGRWYFHRQHPSGIRSRKLCTGNSKVTGWI
jgi:DnaJ C terminal domain